VMRMRLSFPVAWNFRLPNRISNPAGRGSELPLEYIWDLYSMRITIEMAGGKLIFSVAPYLVHQLLVQKVVPTLTSTSAEISRWPVQSNTMTRVLSWFRPWAVRPAGVRSRCCIALHRCACRGGLQVWWERRRGLQVPEV
jgi:hypothetical protein